MFGGRSKDVEKYYYPPLESIEKSLGIGRNNLIISDQKNRSIDLSEKNIPLHSATPYTQWFWEEWFPETFWPEVEKM